MINNTTSHQAKEFDTTTLTALANEDLDITDNLLYIKITGKAGHGKDTIADMLKEHLERGGLSVLKLSYADTLKEEAKKWFGWNGVKDEKGRKILQDVGTQYRGFDEDFWVKEVDKKILKETQKNPDLSVIILPDCRYENEYKKDKGKTIRIEVRRPFYNSSLTDEQQKHESENGITSKPDISIINNSLEQLEQWVIGYIIPNIENKLGCYL